MARRTRLTGFAVALLAVALLLASCSSGGDSSESQSGSGSRSNQSSGSGQSGGASQAAFQPTGAEAAVADYLDGEGHRYVGDCADAQLPRDEGAWCSTLVDERDGARVYEVGPVGEDPELLLTVQSEEHETLTPGFEVQVLSGEVSLPRQLTSEELRNNPFIIENLTLDFQLGIGGLHELPAGLETTPGGDATGGDTGGGTGGPPPDGGAGGGGGAVGGGTVTLGPGSAQYPPGGEVVVENPNVEPGGTVVFRGEGCLPNERLDILFDGKQVGQITADPQGAFAGSLKVPVGTTPGSHLLTVKGSVCELNVAVNVLGGLAFTGASNDTATTVLVGVAAVVLGTVLVMGSRRRRTAAGARSRR